MLHYLEQGNTITQLEAMQTFGLWRLAATIHSLRAKGHRIESQMIRTRGGANVACYWLADANKTR